MNVPPVPLFDCRVSDEAVRALCQVLASGQLASGPAVPALERAFAQLHGDTRQAVAMGDMTHALTLALQLGGVAAGDEVLTLAYNCLSSNSAITSVGARPAWVDIEPTTATMSLESAAAALNSRTRAVLLYHVAGYPANLHAWRDFCDAHGLLLVEDANNALGARWQNQPVGTVGDFAVFSLYANRQVNGIEGAVLLCKDPEHAHRARQLRRFGIDTATFRDAMGEINPMSDVPQVGMSSPLNNVNATLSLHHLNSLEERLRVNRANVDNLRAAMRPTDAQPVDWDSRGQPAFWAMLLQCDRRDALMAAFKDSGVQCSKLHHPNDAYTGFRTSQRDLPGTRRFIERVLAIPCGWWLQDNDFDTISTVLQRFVSRPSA